MAVLSGWYEPQLMLVQPWCWNHSASRKLRCWNDQKMHISHSHPADLHIPISSFFCVPRGGAVFAHLFHHGLPTSHSKSTETETETEVLWIHESPRASAFVSAKMARASGLWDSGTLPITWNQSTGLEHVWNMDEQRFFLEPFLFSQQSLLQGPTRVRIKLEWAMICDKQWQTACRPLCCPFQDLKDLVISEWMILPSTDCSTPN